MLKQHMTRAGARDVRPCAWPAPDFLRAQGAVEIEIQDETCLHARTDLGLVNRLFLHAAQKVTHGDTAITHAPLPWIPLHARDVCRAKLSSPRHTAPIACALPPW